MSLKKLKNEIRDIAVFNFHYLHQFEAYIPNFEISWCQTCGEVVIVDKINLDFRGGIKVPCGGFKLNLKNLVANN